MADEDLEDIHLPADLDLESSMDGEKMPMNKVEDIQKALEPYQERYGHYLKKMRSWREFLKVSKPEGDMKMRLEANLTYYQINYACIFLLLCIASIVLNPRCLIVIAVLVTVWMWFLKKNDDPSWEVNVGGMTLGKTQRWLVLCGLSALAFLMAAGNLIFSSAFFAGIFVVGHGVLHPLPPAEEMTSDSLDVDAI